MDVKWDIQLRPDQRRNPVMFTKHLELGEEIHYPTNEELRAVMGIKEGHKGKRLQTWGRAKDAKGKTVVEHDPHWLAVKNGTPLHVDPRYPRYSHQLKIRVDPPTYVHGIDKSQLILKRGTFYILDTHSPHQVVTGSGELWNVTASIDSHSLLNPNQAVEVLMNYCLNTDFMTGNPK